MKEPAAVDVGGVYHKTDAARLAQGEGSQRARRRMPIVELVFPATGIAPVALGPPR
jgi:hypothetical protein